MRSRTAILGGLRHLLVGLLPLLSIPGPVQTQVPPADARTGEETFRTYCAACHSTGENRILGPGLGGVMERRDRSWLIAKITGPDRLLASGDSISARLSVEHGMSMPNIGMSPGQAEAILAFIAEAPAGGESPAAAAAEGWTEADVNRGMAFFDGRSRFENGGPGCNSCHHVARTGVLGGGSLAVDLTDAHARLGSAVVEAILSAPPFPVMRSAYEGRLLTEPEVAALAAFLQTVSADQGQTPPKGYGLPFFGAGALGTLLLLGISSTVWRNRRRGSVNQSIFDRQVRTN